MTLHPFITLLILSFNLKSCFPPFDHFFKVCEGIIPSLSFSFARLNQITSFPSFQKGFFFPVSIPVALPCSCSKFNSHVLNTGDQAAHIPDVVLPVCYTDSDTHSRQLHLREMVEKPQHIHLISFGMSSKNQTNL